MAVAAMQSVVRPRQQRQCTCLCGPNVILRSPKFAVHVNVQDSTNHSYMCVAGHVQVRHGAMSHQIQCLCLYALLIRLAMHQSVGLLLCLLGGR